MLFERLELDTLPVLSCKLRILGMERSRKKRFVARFIQQSSDNELLVEEGSLYPALERLEYQITAAGRKQLALETRKYAKLTLAVARVMGAE